MFRLLTIPALVVISLTLTNAIQPFQDYNNDFIDPTYILAGNFNPTTFGAQQTIIQWADYLAAVGPWSVMNKSVVPPSGNMHDYMSWSPYYWPNCAGVGNHTALSPEEIWELCPYYARDGQFNPDRLLINNTGDFQAMSYAALYNTLAWVITGHENYSANAAHYIDTWFLNPETAQTPNLNYAQMNRGPDGQIGSHAGVLDLRQMTMVTSAILILRGANSPDWTDELDAQMNDWTTQYLNWLTTSPIADGERIADNNHGTYFYNQLASLQILIGDNNAALASLHEYFTGTYLHQIDADGEQPLEAERTHPYHYRCYNLAAMIANARLASYLGVYYWNTTTDAGSTIQTAVDYTMPIYAVWWRGDGPAWELYPAVAAIASVLGDPDGKYKNFLKSVDANYPAEPYFFWNQPLGDSGLAVIPPASMQTNGMVPSPTASTGLVASQSSVSGRVMRIGMGGNGWWVIEWTVLLVFVSCYRHFWPSIV